MRVKARIYSGTSIVAGKGLGQAVIVKVNDEIGAVQKITLEDIAFEIERFENAKIKAKKYYERRNQISRSKKANEDESAILEMYKYIVNDPIVIKQVLYNISTGLVNAETAVRMTAHEMMETFQEIDDEYLRERDKDIREVSERILHYLSCDDDDDYDESVYAKDVVLFIDRSLILSDIIGNDADRIKAVVCSSSGKTSHAAIVARSNSIPVISDVNFSDLDILEGSEVLVDGNEGIFTINPSKTMIDEYHVHVQETDLQKNNLPGFLKHPVFTNDGMQVSVMANVSIETDARLAVENGADGIGLVRTEILFTENTEFPSESEQIDYYKEIFEEIGPGKKVNIRVMDVGGDKMAKFIDMPEEKNPFMGWRAVRIYRDKSEYLKKQLVAILKAGQDQKYGIMFPMVTTASEWDSLREFTKETANEIGIKCPRLGVLFEIPLAILEIGTFLDTIDFASIGTNDLIQYLSAADRTNAKVNYLYNPIEPAFLKIVKNAIDECHTRGKPVSMCGDMAARPECTILLLGLGLTRFSVSPPMIPIIKEIVSCVSLVKIKEETNHMLLNMRNAAAVADWVDYMNRKYCEQIFKRYRFTPRTREL